MNIQDTLTERGKQYGVFEFHASIAQQLKEVMRTRGGWDHLSYDKMEALEMIQHKIARILNGDPNTHDSWHDIAGYATLIADTLEAK